MTDDEVMALFERAVGEIRRHFDVTAERLEGRIDLVVEALTQLDEKLDRSVDRLDQKIERTAADTQAMIKFSHAELDRRIRTLEEGFADLQARVERLESTH